MNEEFTWKLLDKYFSDNPTSFIDHHLESYNDFFFGGLERIFKEKNPIRIMKQQDPKTNEFRLRCNLYIGGRDGSKIYYGKPMIYNDKDIDKGKK